MIKKIIDKIKKSDVTKNSAWLISEKIIQMILSLVVNRIVVEYLQPENYGTLNYTASIVTFFASLCTLGLDAIVINEIVTKKDEQGEILGTGIFMRIVSSLLSMIMIVIVVVFLNPNNTEILIIAILQAIALLFEAFTLINIWYQSKLQSKYIAIVAFIVYIIVAIIKVTFVFIKKDLIYFAIANTLTSVLTGLFILGLYLKHKGPKLKVQVHRIVPLLKQSYHFILSGLMLAIYAQTDKIMIGKMLTDMSAVGLYSVATTITNLWSFIPMAIVTSFRPVIIELKMTDYNKYIRKLKQLYSFILWINVAYALGVTIFADLIIKILYGEAYLGAKIPLLLAVWSGGFLYLGVARDVWFVSEGLQKYSTKISLVGCITNVALNLLLIPSMGIVGAALATTITQLCTGFISTLLFEKTRINNKYIVEALFFKF